MRHYLVRPMTSAAPTWRQQGQRQSEPTEIHRAVQECAGKPSYVRNIEHEMGVTVMGRVASVFGVLEGLKALRSLKLSSKLQVAIQTHAHVHRQATGPL
jgi:hypothetical protein